MTRRKRGGGEGRFGAEAFRHHYTYFDTMKRGRGRLQEAYYLSGWAVQTSSARGVLHFFYLDLRALVL